MEIVLQWLDELDDLVFAGFSIWSRIRRFCLAVAMIAAAGLHVLPLLGFAIDVKFALIEISLVSLAAWAIVAALSARADRSGQAPSVNA
jgi:hypothetical protein